MAWSKQTRISIMLAIDVAFFLVELISGFLVHSLALMADAFHMLNDIISLIIGLWAAKVVEKNATDKYSYGFLRAEILGAFFNAVFLIALCISIILEALTRFVEPQEVSNPQLILAVGCAGLTSNLVGFLVLGGHGHSHGPGEHSHDHDHEHDHSHEHTHEHDVSAAEEGRAYGTVAADEHDHGHSHSHASPSKARHALLASDDRSASRGSSSKAHGRRRTNSTKHSRLTNIENLSIHPASFRQDIIQHSMSNPGDETDESSAEDDELYRTSNDTPAADENSPLITRGSGGKGHGTLQHSHGGDGHATAGRGRRDSGVHTRHNHNMPKKPRKKGHGHSHDDMGMNAMVLHVLGDALGNVGVIVTALIIWLTDLPGKYYADPAVSLFITLIILKSAIPLTQATSKVLLQATPDHIDPQDIKEDIANLPSVISCHHVHIWQLSDTKLVASLHIQVAFPINAEGGEKYMQLAKQARKCLHAYGIHSATIQPEFCVDEACAHSEDGEPTLDGSSTPRCGAKADGDTTCLLQCVDDCVGQGCCNLPSANASKAGSTRRSSQSSGHGHDHAHNHSQQTGHDHSHDHSHEQHS